MKTNKLIILLCSFVLTLSSNIANAQVNGNVNGFKNKIQEQVVNSNKGIVTVNDSLLDLNGNFDKRNSWLMIHVTKNNYTQQDLIPVTDGNYNTRISLRDGPGLYTVGLYVADAKFSANYTYHKLIIVENTDSRDMSFLLPTYKVQSDDERIKSLALSITKNAQNDEEAFIAIYKYVTKTIKYDYAALENNAYANIDFNAIYTLNNSSAVCEGYANLVAALSRALGIRTKVIFGSVTNSLGTHAWNEVYINNQWKLSDATWDAIHKKYTYLFMDSKNFANEHIKEIEMVY